MTNSELIELQELVDLVESMMDDNAASASVLNSKLLTASLTSMLEASKLRTRALKLRLKGGVGVAVRDEASADLKMGQARGPKLPPKVCSYSGCSGICGGGGGRVCAKHAKINKDLNAFYKYGC